MKVIIYFVFLAVACSANAEEWTFLTDTNDGKANFYIDKASIKRGAMPKGWMLMDYLKPTRGGEKSAKWYMEANCSTGQMRSLSSIFYKENMGSGSVDAYLMDPQQWMQIPPGSALSVVYTALCKKSP